MQASRLWTFSCQVVEAIFNGGFVMWYVLAVLYDFDAGEDELSYKTQTSRGSSEPLLNTANGKA
eukprot:701701-Amphidinium_carterae.1